ncbi:MAG TPA: hypothetical protein VGF55_08105 [Gemmataceae bacterium]|jgi:hypothetical protein
MSTETRDTTPTVEADARAVAEALAAGRPVDPAVARRVRDRSDRARRATEARLGVQDIGARIIREMRDGG